MFLAFAALLTLVAVEADPGAFSWLEGDWVRETSRGEATESWKRVSEDTLEGMAVVHVDGTTRVTEYLRIERFGDEVFYVAKPVGSEYPTAFRLTSLDATRARFENPGHDFPQVISYLRRGEDGFVARIEGPGDEGPQIIDFVFRRKR